jgi:glutamyl-tRNA synthetase
VTETVRVRFAPSPTGKLHIGGARTALFNWAFARHHEGVFVLRVEDTDRERSTPEFEAAILDGLRWLGLDWDEGPDVGGEHGPYYQTQRTAEHLAVAEQLEKDGVGYRCFCTTERLTALRTKQMEAKQTPAYDGLCRDLSRDEVERRMADDEPSVLRFRVPDGSTSFADLIRGNVTVPNADIDDWVMVRTGGHPTYNFVVVCDDVHMGITHVCRGEDHVTNTPKQVLLYEALDLPQPLFAHLPLMLGKDGKKLSKRTGDTSLEDYRDKGYPRAAVLNFLALQGWSLDGATEVFSTDRLIESFALRDVSKGGSIFDPEKFLWMAGEYLRAESPEELAEHCAPFMVAAGLLTAEELEARGDWYVRAVALEQQRILLYSELPESLAYLFAADDAVVYEEKAEKNARKHDLAATLGTYRDWVAARIDGSVDAAGLRDASKAWVAEQGLKFPALFQPLRCALTGKAGGPDLFDVMELMGPERTLRRIDAGLDRLAPG